MLQPKREEHEKLNLELWQQLNSEKSEREILKKQFQKLLESHINLQNSNKKLIFEKENSLESVQMVYKKFNETFFGELFEGADIARWLPVTKRLIQKLKMNSKRRQKIFEKSNITNAINIIMYCNEKMSNIGHNFLTMSF